MGNGQIIVVVVVVVPVLFLPLYYTNKREKKKGNPVVYIKNYTYTTFTACVVFDILPSYLERKSNY